MKKILLVSLFFLSACAAPAPRAAAGRNTIKLTVFHTNDVHGWIMARDAGPKMSAADPKRQLGGFAALASVVRAEKGPKLLLDGGDWFQGTPEGGMTAGRAPIDLMGAVGYDAVVVGNHDFDFNESTLKELAGRATMPVLSANTYDEKTGARVPYVKARIIKEVAGIKVGIFGLTTSNMRNLAFKKNYAGLSFRDESDEAKEQVAALKAEGAELIIAVTHVGFRRPEMTAFEDDQAVAAAVPGIDLIVGGHTHTPLFDPVREPGNGTWIVQAGHYLQHVGRIDLYVDKTTHKLTSAKGWLLPLWVDKVGEAQDILEKIKGFQAEVGKDLDVVIGTATASFGRSQTEESTMGNWMTDCLMEDTHTEAAFQNAGGIRSEITAGPVSLRTIYQVMPFDNRVVTLKLKGADLHDVLENGVAGTHGLLQMAGTSIVYDAALPAGKRVVEEKIGGKALKPAKEYAVVSSDFMVMGGDGYGAFSRATAKDEKDDLLRDVLVRCVKRHPEFGPPSVGRIRKK